LTGYNPLANPVTLTLVADVGLDKDTNTDAFVLNTFDQVENNKGTQLPSTGGIGTTIFYVVGGVLVLAAIILLVTKKRMSE
jgi:LPXTG-motif cell wall-anchored protein